MSKPFGIQKQSISKDQERKKKKEEKHLPQPNQWKNAARKEPAVYSKEKWKELGRAGQEQYIQGCRQKPHRYLSLCYPQRFPPDFPYAWDSLTDDGKF